MFFFFFLVFIPTCAPYNTISQKLPSFFYFIEKKKNKKE